VFNRLAEVRDWTRTHQGKKIVRFAMSSVITTAISSTVILLAYGLNGTHSPVWATAIGNLAAMPPAYYLHRRWVWGKTGASHWRNEVIPYTVLNVLGLLLSLVFAAYCRHLVYANHWTHLANTVFVGVVNLISFAVFWVLKLILFNRIFHTTPIAAYDEHLTAEERNA